MLENNKNTQIRNSEEIKKWLIQELAQTLDISKEKIDPKLPFSHYGIDSAEAVILTGKLGKWMNRELPATLLWDYPSIEQLSNFLIDESKKDIDEGTSRESDIVRYEPIAIIGIGCRFPGANNPDEFWNVLRNGKDMIVEFPQSRLKTEDECFTDPISWKGGFLEKIEYFDYNFFGISPREAKLMDPQQRLLLQLTWEAFEDAGIPVESLSDTMTGVFVGISSADYMNTCIGLAERKEFYSITGNTSSIAANRISYLFDFKGPSMAVDTACSSSLVAVHQACNSIKLGECDIAVAAGVNILIDQTITNVFKDAGMLSKDAKCKTFDAEANGYVRGEGAGVVILKPLSKAIEDGNYIYAIIKGRAMNQDGKSNGITAPNMMSQVALLKEAYRRAGIAPNEVQYVEAHGTGTVLGDPIEVKAMGKVFSANRAADESLRIGSVKTNIGHLEAAAGIAGLIKTALSLDKKEIPPSISFMKPNEHIPFEDLNITVQNKLTPWDEKKGKRYAGVSSFGFGGTNVHVVLEGYNCDNIEKKMPLDNQFLMLPISAKTSKGVYDNVQKYAKFIKNNVDLDINHICASAGKKRDHHRCRVVFTGSSKQEILYNMDLYLSNKVSKGIFQKECNSNENPKVAYVFSGQGPTQLSLGKELIKKEPVFFANLKVCDRLFQKISGWSIIDEMMKDISESKFYMTKIAQPIIFSIQVSLVELWKSWGISCEAMVGHSVGEIAAAYCSGAISLEDALKIVYHRSVLMDSILGLGRMAAIQASINEVEEVIEKFEGKVCVGAYNGPESIVISGDSKAVEKAVEEFQNKKIHCKMLEVEYAFHSHQTEDLVERLNESLKGIKSDIPTIDIYSTLTGKLADIKSFNSKYWGMQMRNPVRFDKTIEALLEDGFNMFIEMNQKPILSGDIMKISSNLNKQCIVIPAISKSQAGYPEMRLALARVYSNGYQVNWSGVFPLNTYVKIPTYSWQEEYCWTKSKREFINFYDSEILSKDEQYADCEQNETDANVSESILEKLKIKDVERKSVLVSYFKEQVSRVLHISSDELDIEQPLNTMGIDSIMTVELKNRVQNDLQISLPIAKLMDGGSISSVLDDILNRIDEVLEKKDEGSSNEDLNSEELDVMNLSEEDLDKMLQELMNSNPA